MGDWVFGCDLCQNACPMNRGKYLGTIDNAEETRPKLSDLLNLTNAGFKARFAGTAAGWRGKKILQRNAAIVLENLRA
jgi:epoxyqueuosine reductase